MIGTIGMFGIARSVALADCGPTFQKQKLQMEFREDFAWSA
jgi:hypothetical protein